MERLVEYLKPSLKFLFLKLPSTCDVVQVSNRLRNDINVVQREPLRK